MTVENFPAKATELKVFYVIITSKPRVVKLSIKPDGKDEVFIGGIGRRTKRFNVHVEIGGVIGVIAPVVGKQPSDLDTKRNLAAWTRFDASRPQAWTLVENAAGVRELASFVTYRADMTSLIFHGRRCFRVPESSVPNASECNLV